VNKGKIQVALKALLVNPEGRVLLLRRCHSDTLAPDEWDTPGGKMHFGEAPGEALRREVLEETGITIAQVSRVLNVWTLMKSESKQLVGITYICEYDGGQEVRLSSEHDDHSWVDVAEILRDDGLAAGLRKTLVEYMQAIDSS
jgi:8-oxo-dGTP diphosphatase